MTSNDTDNPAPAPATMREAIVAMMAQMQAFRNVRSVGPYGRGWDVCFDNFTALITAALALPDAPPTPVRCDYCKEPCAGRTFTVCEDCYLKLTRAAGIVEKAPAPRGIDPDAVAALVKKYFICDFFSKPLTPEMFVRGLHTDLTALIDTAEVGGITKAEYDMQQCEDELSRLKAGVAKVRNALDAHIRCYAWNNDTLKKFSAALTALIAAAGEPEPMVPVSAMEKVIMDWNDAIIDRGDGYQPMDGAALFNAIGDTLAPYRCAEPPCPTPDDVRKAHDAFVASLKRLDEPCRGEGGREG